MEAHRRSRGTVVVVSGDADFAHGLDFARRQGWRTARLGPKRGSQEGAEVPRCALPAGFGF